MGKYATKLNMLFHIHLRDTYTQKLGKAAVIVIRWVI